MPRKPKPSVPPPRRERGQGSVTWVESRKRWRARLPKAPGEKARETWHTTRDEAAAWIVRELQRGPDAFDPSETLGAYMNYWFRLVGGRWGPQTRRRYAYEAAALGELVKRPLDRCRGDHFAAAQADILARGCTRRYAYNVLSLYKRALADAVKWKILAENVVETVTLPDPERKRQPAWTLPEVRAVLKAIVGHRFEACYLLILWGGLRIGEVVGLRWDQIGDDGLVAFAEAEHSHLRGRPIGTTKRERDRETQIPAHVVTRLKALRASGPAPMAFPTRPRVDVAYVYVAQRPDGNRWTPRQIRDDWKALVENVTLDDDETKIKQLRPHGGRRSFGTMHMVARTPLADLSTLMGHSSPAVTAASYLDSSRDRQREAAERLAELLEPHPGTSKGQVEGQSDALPG